MAIARLPGELERPRSRVRRAEVRSPEPAAARALVCPGCDEPLVALPSGRVLTYRCARCNGIAATLAALRSRHDSTAVNAVWNRSAPSATARRCPGCRDHMRVATVAIPAEGSLELDVCKRCHLVWFDRDELARLPLRPGAAPNVDAADAPSTRRLHPTTRRVARIASARPTVDAGDLGCVIIELAIDAALAILG